MRTQLFLKRLDLGSGAGQLLRMQVNALRAAGVATVLACERGALRYFLRTGIRARRTSVAALRARRDPLEIIADHEMAVPEADVVFVHNLATDANRFLPAANVGRAEYEREFFAALPDHTPIVANSALVKTALVEHFALRPERIVVHYPGYQAARFVAGSRRELRARARRQLGFGESAPVVGLVTSGDFRKRGLDSFLAVAERIAAAEAEARFLVVGARELPQQAAGHPLFRSGTAVYRPKNHSPELCMAALDLFVYPAHYEEFGMVVLEALALGVPVVTSRRVGAAECLPAEYAPWLGAAPDAEEFGARALALLRDRAAYERLSAAGVQAVRGRDDARYGTETAATILAQKRRLK
jgi:glycosyltransferase involved in cell wall biosynthesis